jgi:tetratricopeptide (TPR) repeat protein
VRADPLQGGGQPQGFSFAPIGARWIMLRFTPAAKAQFVAIADVAVLGHAGPPVSHYAFKETPAKALDVLARLKSSTAVNLSISSDELSLLGDVKDGHLSKWSFDEAVLLASGVRDAGRRKQYIKQLDALEGKARETTGKATGTLEKGEKLLAFLHDPKGPLAKGYVSRQTDLSAVLDQGTFNCVSSATLYAVLGRRLGLDIRAIEVPEHAFAILYDGTRHADVETTTSSGFDPARDQASREQFQAKTGFRYIPDSNRDQRREVSEAGLVAIIYYNHGVGLTEQKRHYEALLAYFRAMSLDREFDSAVKNALASLANWGNELCDGGKFEEAVSVIRTGLELAPKDALLLSNYKAAWQQWAEAAATAGKDDEAIAILRRAAVAAPDGGFPAMQAWIYIRRGEESIRKGSWQQAAAAVEPGLAKLDPVPKAELRRWMSELPIRWANEELQKKHFENAVAVLNHGRALDPKDERLAHNIIYAVQEWAKDAQAKAGDAKAKAILVAQIKRFPDVAGLKDVADSFLIGTVNNLRDAQKYDAALAAVDQNRDLLQDKNTATTLTLSVFDAWAGELSGKKQWSQAAGVYEKGLRQMPANEHLVNNLVYVIQEWVEDTSKSAGQPQARKLLLDLKERFPKLAKVDEIAKNHVQRVVIRLRDAGAFDDALAAADKNKDLLKDSADQKNLAYAVYDAWANGLQGKGNWQGAVDVYAKGLQRLPKDGHLANNAVATWNAWAATRMNVKDWDGAIKIYEKALLRFPDNSVLTNNAAYCKQQSLKR